MNTLGVALTLWNHLLHFLLKPLIMKIKNDSFQ